MLISCTHGSSVSAGSSALAMSTFSRTSVSAWSASKPASNSRITTALPSDAVARISLSPSIVRSSFSIGRTQQALGVFGRDAFVRHVDVQRRDRDVGLGLFRDRQVRGAAGDQQHGEDQQHRGGAVDEASDQLVHGCPLRCRQRRASSAAACESCELLARVGDAGARRHRRPDRRGRRFARSRVPR